MASRGHTMATSVFFSWVVTRISCAISEQSQELFQIFKFFQTSGLQGVTQVGIWLKFASKGNVGQNGVGRLLPFGSSHTAPSPY